MRAKQDTIDPAAPIVIFGADNRIGRLVSEQLVSSGLQVRMVGSSADWASSEASGSAQVFLGNPAQDPARYGMEELFLLRVQGAASFATPLREAMRGAQAVVVCPESTAFPSPAWIVAGRSPRQQHALLPRNVAAALDPAAARRVVLLSAIGAARALPRVPRLDENLLLAVTNAFGALDQFRVGEEAVRAAAGRAGCDAVIVRAKLHCYAAGPFGGPDEVLP